jgi:hypothetical protein
MTKRNRMLSTLAVGIAATATLGLAGPAQADPVSQGEDYAFHSDDGKQLTVCDVEDDNRAVWAGYYTTESYQYQTLTIRYPSDPDGVNCASRRVGTRLDSIVLSNLRVVEDNPSSSTNYYGAWHGYPVRG